MLLLFCFFVTVVGSVALVVSCCCCCRSGCCFCWWCCCCCKCLCGHRLLPLGVAAVAYVAALFFFGCCCCCCFSCCCSGGGGRRRRCRRRRFELLTRLGLQNNSSSGRGQFVYVCAQSHVLGDKLLHPSLRCRRSSGNWKKDGENNFARIGIGRSALERISPGASVTT